LDVHHIHTQLNMLQLFLHSFWYLHHISNNRIRLCPHRLSFQHRDVFAIDLFGNSNIFNGDRTVLDHIGAHQNSKIFCRWRPNCMVQLPCRLRPLNLSFREVTFILCDGSKTEIFVGIIITINSIRTGSKSNLLSIWQEHMEHIVFLVVKLNMILALQLKETQDVGQCSFVMPDLTIVFQFTSFITLQDSSIGMQSQTRLLLLNIFKQILVTKDIS